jgi:hypothetical protein
MGEKVEKIKELQKEQKLLKKEIKSLKKQIPYFIIGFIFFSIGFISVFEGKLNSLFGNSSNLILSIIVLLVLTSITYIILIAFKVKVKNSQIKTIGLELYNMMKLKSES